MNQALPTAQDFIEATQHVENGPLGLDHMAGLRGAAEPQTMNFTFEYQGFVFAVRADAKEQRTNMTFNANLGSLPFTAEDPVARANAMTVLSAASRALGGRVKMTRRQRIVLTEDIVIDEPLTPILLMSRAARLLLRAKPYLELLSDYIRPPKST